MTSASPSQASAAAPLHRVLRWLASTERGATGERWCARSITSSTPARAQVRCSSPWS